MTRLMTVIGLIVLATAVSVSAQQPAATGDRAQTPTPPGAHMGGMMPMHMCREMMTSGQSTMGPGMMGEHSMMGGNSMMGAGMMGPGMMGGQPADPKTMAHMMEMRGEMMKAMGDIMLKHAKRMKETPPPAR